MENRERARWTAFEGFRCIASGELAQVALATKNVLDREGRARCPHLRRRDRRAD